ncbi:SDR family NAD(P)-dependent oxidoreductase [Parvularcula marina]|uniref:SDR family oxidoreductase n=1 Tax=Parvularcula marina TaxID=2292771 RepID=A0A371RLH2_9PROT|nr:SDR family oxidoreductase [Parvularcula marina]RFB06271.1 SDR family oxidoreductase [Parvularcula marina]
MSNQAEFNLTGRIVIITGASSGLGAHLAGRLAAAGANVVAGARRLDRLDEIAKSAAATGGNILPVQMDVEDPASIVSAFDAAEERFGPVDTVVANAGFNVPSFAVDLPAEDLRRMMAVNIEGVFLTAREAAKRLIDKELYDRGRMVLLGSVGSLRPLPGLTAYSMSKAAVAMMGKGLAREWARYGVNVNTICPGWIATELNSDWLESEAGQKLVKTFPRRRVMKPGDLDSLVLFLCSDASASLTGGVFAVDEGQSLA